MDGKRRRGKTPGLYRDGKTGAWKIDKVWKGRRIRGSVGSNFGEAEGELLDRINELIAGQKAPRARCTFEEAALHYLELHPTKLSIDEERTWLLEMMPHIGKLPLDRIYDKTLQPFVNEQRKKKIRRRGGWQIGLKSKSINLKLGLIRHILILASRSWRDDDGEPWLPAAPLITMLQGGDEREPRQLTWQEQRVQLSSGKHGTIRKITDAGRIEVEIDGGETLPYPAKYLTPSTKPSPYGPPNKPRFVPGRDASGSRS